ncbi:MAG TPA: MBL fold metallo-hydrolase [Thermoanaerobaculia bacterium]|nr:MBL fold metallo-hydrolase [Thermoanaerobaculia bacterium]
MRLHFYGTKGYVEESSRAHSGHSAFVLESEGFRLLCDFGENRKGMLGRIAPDAIFVSHAHPDHAWGLQEGTRLPVYASAVTHEITRDLPIETRIVLETGRREKIGPLSLTACPVVHSVRCPCVGARIATKEGVLVYSGDVISFENPEAALSGARLYIGDGSTLKGSLVRRHGSGALMGHTTMRAQLGWLGKFAVPRAIFSHFGKGPIEMGDQALKQALAELARDKAPGCQVESARDGLQLELRL